MPRLTLEDLTLRDIAIYVRDKLQSHPKFRKLKGYDNCHENLIKVRGSQYWNRALLF